MSQGQRILLVTPTNVATDVATMAILRRMPSFAEGSIVRVGQPADPALLDRPGGQVLVDQIAAKRGEPIARRLVDIRTEIHRARDELNKLKAAAKASRRLTAQQDDQRIRLEHIIAELQLSRKRSTSCYDRCVERSVEMRVSSPPPFTKSSSTSLRASVSTWSSSTRPA